jgi:hypothetical protein
LQKHHSSVLPALFSFRFFWSAIFALPSLESLQMDQNGVHLSCRCFFGFNTLSIFFNNYFNVKNKFKKIIKKYFQAKITLKNNLYYNLKHAFSRYKIINCQPYLVFNIMIPSISVALKNIFG